MHDRLSLLNEDCLDEIAAEFTSTKLATEEHNLMKLDDFYTTLAHMISLSQRAKSEELTFLEQRLLH
jgi:hypothetical protein